MKNTTKANNQVYWTVFNKESFTKLMNFNKRVCWKGDHIGSIVYRDKSTGRFKSEAFTVA